MFQITTRFMRSLGLVGMWNDEKIELASSIKINISLNHLIYKVHKIQILYIDD
jgi:uncharacterized protein YabE (DUF348 family)